MVTAHGVLGLQPRFVRALRRLLTRRGLLLMEDAVMVGLRSGAPFLGSLCGGAPDAIAIGKAWGFSGVVINEAAMQHVSTMKPDEPRLAWLFGFLTICLLPSWLLLACLPLTAWRLAAAGEGARLAACRREGARPAASRAHAYAHHCSRRYLGAGHQSASMDSSQCA